MKNQSSSKGVSYRCLLYCIAILLLVMIPLKSFSQSTGELTTDSLVKMGFENVRWTDTPEERVYVVENSAYKIQALGIRKAVDIIQSMGLPKDKSCKLIVTNYNIPQVSLTYQPLAGDTTVVSGEDWKVSYDIGDSWDKVKKEKKVNLEEEAIYEGLASAGYSVSGGVNAPYIWLKTPDKMTSWEFFDYLLEKANIVGTPGSGFGAHGEGFFRLTAFGTHENTLEAIERIKNL